MKKSIIGIMIAILIAISTIVPATAETGDKEIITDYILGEFMKIAQIPRGSEHTDAISDYLKAWGEDRGFEVMQDEVGNIRWDVPATPGYENAPLTALQTHMDMVAVSDDGRDMTKSPITAIVNEEAGTLTSDGHTSLGADDGIGIAMTMYLCTTATIAHGPLRAIITVNEEGGEPSGVEHMDHAWIDGVTYLVNLDDETYLDAIVSTCAMTKYDMTLENESVAPDADRIAYAIEIKDLYGGHSGVDIGKNRANAIRAVNYCLAYAKYSGVDVTLASFAGGTAANAIPSTARAVVTFSPEYEAAFKAVMEETLGYFNKQYKNTDPDYAFTYAPVEMPEKVLTRECTAKLVDLIATLREGVNTVSTRYEGITESSFNLAIVDIDAATPISTIRYNMRTSAKWPGMLANMQMKAIADAFGATFEDNTEGRWTPETIQIGWVEKEGDEIQELFREALKKATGDDANITAVHGGTECATFAEWRDDLQMICVGPTIVDPHSCKETLYLDTVWKTTNAVEQLLTDIADHD